MVKPVSLKTNYENWQVEAKWSARALITPHGRVQLGSRAGAGRGQYGTGCRLLFSRWHRQHPAPRSQARGGRAARYTPVMPSG